MASGDRGEVQAVWAPLRLVAHSRVPGHTPESLWAEWGWPHTARRNGGPSVRGRAWLELAQAPGQGHPL